MYNNCDFCEVNSDYNIRAIAKYIDSEGQRRIICKKHLKLIKGAGFDFEMIQRENKIGNNNILLIWFL